MKPMIAIASQRILQQSNNHRGFQVNIIIAWELVHFFNQGVDKSAKKNTGLLIMDDDEQGIIPAITQENITKEDKEEQEMLKMQIEEMIQGEENHSAKRKGAFNSGSLIDYTKYRQRGNSEHTKREDLGNGKIKYDSIFEDLEQSKSPRRMRKGDENIRLSHGLAKEKAIELPHIDKSNFQLLRIDLDDPIKRGKAEHEMKEWVKSFIIEIERIETFYVRMHLDYKEQFNVLRNRYLRKQNQDPLDDDDRATTVAAEEENFQIQNQMSLISKAQLNNSSLEDTLLSRDKLTTIQPDGVGTSSDLRSSNARFQQSPSRLTSDFRGNSIKVISPRYSGEALTTTNISKFKKRSRGVDDQKITKVKDELEYATNWRRAFNKIFTHLKWLNAYAKINYIALLKIQKKFMKNYFHLITHTLKNLQQHCKVDFHKLEYIHLKDNIIDKKLLSLIDSQNFATRKIVNSQIHELVQFFSENFTNGNKDKAHDLLEQHNAPIRKKDAMLIAYFVGLLTMITFAFMVLIFMPQSDSMFDRPGAAIEIYANLKKYQRLKSRIQLNKSVNFL